MVPKFLKNLDRYLLLHYPVLWISRVHYVLPVLALLSAFFWLISTLLPIDVRERSGIENWWLVFVLISVLITCFWVFYSVIFSVEKIYGRRSILDEYKLFFIYLFVFAGLTVWCWPFFLQHKERVAALTTEQELISDINMLNLGHKYFLENHYEYMNVEDTVREFSPYTGRDTVVVYECILPGRYENHMRFMPNEMYDSAAFPGVIRGWTMERMKDDRDDIRLKRIEDYLSVYRKYRVDATADPMRVLQVYNSVRDSMIRLQNFGMLGVANIEYYTMTTVVDNISEAKYDLPWFMEEAAIWTEVYLGLYLTLLFLMFRNVNWKHFIVTIVSLIVLSIIFTVFVNILPGVVREELVFVYLWMVIYLGALITVVWQRLTAQRFSAFVSVLVQFLFLASPLLFLSLNVWLDSAFDIYGRQMYRDLAYTGDGYYNGEYIAELNRRDNLFNLCNRCCAIGGMVFQALVVIVVAKEEFVRMYSIPKNK